MFLLYPEGRAIPGLKDVTGSSTKTKQHLLPLPVISLNPCVGAYRQKKQPSLFQELNDEENLILNVLRQQGEAQINQLTVMLEMTASQVLSNLIELEFKNLIRTFPGGVYRPV